MGSTYPPLSRNGLTFKGSRKNRRISKKSRKNSLIASSSHRNSLTSNSSHRKSSSGFGSYSRLSEPTGYAKQRRKRARRKSILLAASITLLALLVAAIVAVACFLVFLQRTIQKDFDSETLKVVTVEPAKPEDPFWTLLVGLDEEEYGLSRTDTIILARIDPARKTAALISIPRDAFVSIPGYGYDKINAAYVYGTLDSQSTGPELLIRTITNLTGIDIAYYVQIDLGGFSKVIDTLGGVYVDVPVDVYNNYDWNAPAYESDYPAIYAGEHQLLKGEYALLFVRCRNYGISDYQRQANQRTFLQAMAKQILSSNPLTIMNTVTQICQFTSTNMNVQRVASIAGSMRGVQESDFYTYSIPCSSENTTGTWYEIPNYEGVLKLFAAIDSGEFPDPDEFGYSIHGTTPDRYKPGPDKVIIDLTENTPRVISTSEFLVDVRNGWGTPGVATAVSDMLAIAGYRRGEIGNANSMVYTETLIVYRDSDSRIAAEDIQARLGFGRVIPSLTRYAFNGDILVVVGSELDPKAN